MPQKQASSPYPTLEEQATYFDAWNARCRAKDFDEIDPETKAGAEKILELLDSLPLKRPAILEVGCGTGWLTEKLIRFGNTMAIDLSARAIGIAKQRGLDATFITGDFYKQDFPHSHFDVVILAETISCIPDQPLFVEKLASLMKPGAFLILTSLNKFVFQRRSDFGPRPRAEISNWLSRKELHQLFNRDFRILQSFTVRPNGDKGLLRIVNSYKLNWVLNRVFPERIIACAKEKLGLGMFRVILAERNSC